MLRNGLPDSRFIPARAGNSKRSGTASSAQAVHPRACGELPSSLEPVNPWGGSSPRVRGTHGQREYARDASRFIPARAGNSASRGGRWNLYTVHPRACGELELQTWIARQTTGSSPRVRGTRGLEGLPPEMFRFIPARAGNSA